MKMKLLLVALFVSVLSLGCKPLEVYTSLRGDYSAFKSAIAAQCTSGEISEARCTLLAAADKRLVALDKIVNAGESTRKQIKDALEQLELVVEQQKDALSGY